MKLNKAQKQATLEWIAEGLQSDEINRRAALFEPVFDVSRSQVDYYRKTRKVDIDAIRADGEHKALNTGLAVISERVIKLKKLAELLEADLFDNDLLWTINTKGVGSGSVAEVVEYLEFNRAEVDAYRGVLDDIAKELSHRIQRKEVTGAGGADLVINVKVGDGES